MTHDSEITIGNIIDEEKIAYISSMDGEGFPCTRAMLAPRKRVGIREIFFTTNTSSRKVKEFRANPKGCLYFCDSAFFKGVMLKGAVEVMTDSATKEEIWRDGDTKYYSKGVTDPDYCVLKFTAVGGRYYSPGDIGEFSVE